MAAGSGEVLMTEGSYKKSILRFAVPILIGSFFQQMYNTVDSLIVGNFCGSASLAAVSSAGNLLFMIVGFFAGMSIGSTVVISSFIGSREEKKVEEAVHTTVALGLLTSLLISLVGVLLTPTILRWMDTPPDVMPKSVTYFRVYFLGAVGLTMYNTFVGIIRAAGDSKHPLYYLIISSVLNVILDILIVGILGYDVGGAAFATVISQIVSALLVMRDLIKAKGLHRLFLKKISIDPRMAKKIIKLGLPSGLMNSMISFSNVLIQSYVNYYGKMAMAGIGAYIKIEGFSFIPTQAFSMAITTYIGQNIGAGEVERAKKGINFGMLCTILIAETIGFLIFILAPLLIKMFNADPEVIAYGVQRARICAPFFCLVSYSHFMSAVVRGLGRAITPMVIMLTLWCGVRILVLSISSFFFHDIRLTHWIYPITWSMSAIAFTFSYNKIDLNKASI
jgi:putative MATE family efflux protein